MSLGWKPWFWRVYYYDLPAWSTVAVAVTHICHQPFLTVVSRSKLTDALANRQAVCFSSSSSGELFAQAPINEFPSISVETVSDSSRYFVLRIQDDNGVHPPSLTSVWQLCGLDVCTYVAVPLFLFLMILWVLVRGIIHVDKTLKCWC